jgi:fucose permease
LNPAGSLAGTLAGASLALAIAGAGLATVGPFVSTLVSERGLEPGVAGLLFTAQFTGFVLTVPFAGAISDRLGPRRLCGWGLAVSAGGLALLGLASEWPLMLAGGAIYGLGFGVVDVTALLLVARRAGGGATSALNLANVFFGVGSAAGPLLFGALGPGAFLVLGGAAAVLAPGLRWLGPEAGSPRPSAGGIGADLVMIVALGVMLLFYVGAETGFGGWAVNLTATGPVAASIFWGSLALGRIAGAGLGRALGARGLIGWGLAVAVCGQVLVALGPASLASLAGAALIGFGFGPVWPSILALGAERHGLPGRVAGAAIALGGLGGAVLPWLHGVILGSGGRVAAVGLNFGLLIVLSVMVSRFRPRIAARPPAKTE